VWVLLKGIEPRKSEQKGLLTDIVNVVGMEYGTPNSSDVGKVLLVELSERFIASVARSRE
jgi:hypothetical protein